MAIKPISDIQNKRNNLTAEYIRALLEYNPETGIFTWKSRDNIRPSVNSRLRGKKAGCKTVDGYISICIDELECYAHRLAWLYIRGEWPINGVDHKDTNRANNKWDNLREATQAQNIANCKVRKHNKSGIKGIYKHHNRWIARIVVNKKGVHLGSFLTPEDAHNAYCQAAEKYYGEFSRFN